MANNRNREKQPPARREQNHEDVDRRKDELADRMRYKRPANTGHKWGSLCCWSLQTR